MSDDGKETLASGRGFDPAQAKKYRMERLARPSQWSPGVRVTSAEEYDRFTDQLARELLTSCTPEHLAVIAAQQMMYADELKHVLEEKKAERGIVITALTEAAGETATDAAMLVLKAYRARETRKRMGGLVGITERRAFINAEIERHAKELWANDTDKEYKVAEMAGLVRDAVERDYPGEVPGLERIKVLIRPFAPEYASTGGAPRGPRKRSKP